MNYVGIDTSLSSTGVYILLEDGNESFFNYRNNDKLSKWHRTCGFINYRSYQNVKHDDYSDNEVSKILNYNKITDMIVADIITVIGVDGLSNTSIITEGYSYGSTGAIIDLVTYATLVRNKLLNLNINNFIIKAPSSLKKDTCIKVYGPGDKKKPSRNTLGIAGGSFKKPDMLMAAMDKKDLESIMKEALVLHNDELMKMKSIPSPIQDIVDAFWLVHSTKD